MTALTAFSAGDGNIAAFNHRDATALASVVLSTASSVAVTIPTGTRVVLFRGDGNFFYQIDAVAVVPTVTATSGASLYVPADSLEGEHFMPPLKPATINFIRGAASSTTITVYFYGA